MYVRAFGWKCRSEWCNGTSFYNHWRIHLKLESWILSAQKYEWFSIFCCLMILIVQKPLKFGSCSWLAKFLLFLSLLQRRDLQAEIYLQTSTCYARSLLFHLTMQPVNWRNIHRFSERRENYLKINTSGSARNNLAAHYGWFPCGLIAWLRALKVSSQPVVPGPRQASPQ